jgi:plastocyanin
MKWEERQAAVRSPWPGLITVLAAILVGITMGLSNDPSSQNGTLYVVEMRDFFFDPPGLFLQPGDRVLWVLLEDQLGDGHSATAYHPRYDKTSRIPEGAEPWSSPLLTELGSFYERAFTTVGVHDYFCIPHEDMGMVGRIVVREATGPGTRPVSEGISPAGQSSLPTIEELTGPVGLVFNLQARINTSVFHARRRDRAEALHALDETGRGLEAGAGREESLYETLRRVRKLDVVLEGLSALREAIASSDQAGAGFNYIGEIAEDLKAELDEAIQALASL